MRPYGEGWTDCGAERNVPLTVVNAPKCSALLQLSQTGGETMLTQQLYFLKELDLCSLCKWKRI